MPEKKVIERAAEDRRQGKASTTQAGEFVREEMHHIRARKQARSTKQAIAIGLSKARRAGVKLSPPQPGTASAVTRKSAARATAAAARGAKPESRRRSRAVIAALKREGHAAASPAALARQAKSAAQKRTAGARAASAMRAVRTKGPLRRSAAARKAARTRARSKS